MDKIKPKKVSVEFTYECPKCGADIWHNMRVIQQMKYLPCECCGVDIPLFGVDSIYIRYKQDKKYNKSDESNQNDLNRFITPLVAVGVRVKAAERLIKKLSNEYKDDQQFLELLLKSMYDE